jgi:hypothetical protein
MRWLWAPRALGLSLRLVGNELRDLSARPDLCDGWGVRDAARVSSLRVVLVAAGAFITFLVPVVKAFAN